MSANPFHQPGKPHRAQRVRTHSATPPAAAQPAAVTEGEASLLWLFTHANPNYPATLTLTVNAPTLSEARGVAYLLAEDFCAKAIGQIKAEGI